MVTRGYITKHFTWREAQCKCGCSIPTSLVPNIKRAAREVEQVRELLGNHPMFTHSWYRCKKWNALVGGAPQSQHLLGLAIDFTVKTMVPQTVQAMLLKQAWPALVKGLGRYPGFTHIDFRTTVAQMWNVT